MNLSQSYKKYNKGNNRSPKNKTVYEQNSAPKQDNTVYEFQSYHSYNDIALYGYTLDILDLYKPNDLIGMARNPMLHHKELAEISQMLYNTNGTFSNTVNYQVAMPTLDYVIVAHGSNKKKNKKAQNKSLMDMTLRNIRHERFMRDALWRDMVNGECYYYFETNTTNESRQKNLSDFDVESIFEINELGVKASVISLPDEYVRIIRRKNSSPVIAFNLEYFKSGEENEKSKLKKFPKEIRKAYDDWSKNKTKYNWYILDNSRTIVHKINSADNEPHGRPLVLPAINDILYRDFFTQTKRGVLEEVNNRIIYETFPEGKEKGLSSLTQKAQKLQHETIKDAIMTKNERNKISFFSAAAGTKISTIETPNTQILDSKYESNLDDRIALGLGFASASLNGVGSGSYSGQITNLELVSAQIFQWVDEIAEELNKCISANIIKDNKNWVEVKYLPITHVNKKNMVGYAKDLYLQGCGSISLWASATGISPETFFALLDQEQEAGIYEKYQPHQTSYTLSGKANQQKQSGRPTDDDSLNDNTIKSKSNNGNANPSPSDNQ